jgi:hypothetical protein
MLVNESGLTVDFSPGHVSPQTDQQRCEILRMDGPNSGDVTFSVSTPDGHYVVSHVVNVNFGPEPESESIGAVVVVGGGMGGLALLGLVLFLLRGRNEDEFDPEPAEFTSGPPVSVQATTDAGPNQNQQVTASSGPPVSTAAEAESAPAVQSAGPPLPATGLPPGWTEEQWAYYGQQYLDGAL